MGKELYTAKQFIDAIPGTGGIVATIADRVGKVWRKVRENGQWQEIIREHNPEGVWGIGVMWRR